MTGIGRSSCFDHTWCHLLTGVVYFLINKEALCLSEADFKQK